MNRAQEIAWAAGLFEGEGCACVTTNRGCPVALLKVAMLDEFPVRKFYEIFERRGSFRLHNPPSRNYEPLWYWSAQKKQDVIDIGTKLLPYMSPRRADALKAAIAVARTRRPVGRSRAR